MAMLSNRFHLTRVFGHVAAIMLLLLVITPSAESLGRISISKAAIDDKSKQLSQRHEWRNGVVNSQDLGGREWFAVFADLIDWDWYRYQSESLSLSGILVRIPSFSLSVELAQSRLNKILLSAIKSGKQSANDPREYRLRAKFVDLLRRVDHRLVSVGEHWLPKRFDMELSLKGSRSQIRDWSTMHGLGFGDSTPGNRDLILRYPKNALKLAHDFEEFANDSQNEVVIAGYAKLYAAILRMNWTYDVQSIGNLLQVIENQYRKAPEIAVMAAWYRAILEANYGRPTARDSFRHLADTYRNLDWWVVEAARAAPKGGPPQWEAAGLVSRVHP